MEDKGTFVINTEMDTAGVTRGVGRIREALANAGKAVGDFFKTFHERLNANNGEELDIRVNDEEIIDLVDELNIIKRKMKELEDQGYGAGTQEWDDLYTRLSEIKPQIDDYKKRLLGVDEATKKVEKSTKNMEKATRKSGISFKLGLETILKQGIKTILKYAFGIRSLFMLFNKLRSAVSEGIKNLVQVDETTNQSMSALSSSLTALKNGTAAAVAPLLNALAPALTYLIDLLTQAAYKVGQFFAALTGQTSFIKAVKAQTDYAKSLDSTADSAKKAKGALASFDELNTLSSSADSSSDTGVAKPEDMFETVEIEAEAISAVERIKAIFAPLEESFTAWQQNLNFEPLKASLQGLYNACKPIIDNIGTGLKWVFDNVLAPIGSFVIESALPAFFDTLASATEYVTTALEVLKPTFEYIWENILKPMGAFIGDTFLSLMATVQDLFNGLAETFKSRGDDINNILIGVAQAWQVLCTNGKTIIQFLTGIIKGFVNNIIIPVVNRVITVLSGIVRFLDAVFKGDWEAAWQSIKDVFLNIWNLLVDIVEGVINTIIDGLNMISVDIPEWVPKFGGQTWGINFDHVSLPRLATGTVVPRSSSEFAAILGDNNRETEVVSPLSTIEQALRNVMAERGQEVNVYITADGDMDALIRQLNFRLSKENSRVGKSFVRINA